MSIKFLNNVEVNTASEIQVIQQNISNDIEATKQELQQEMAQAISAVLVFKGPAQYLGMYDANNKPDPLTLNNFDVIRLNDLDSILQVYNGAYRDVEEGWVFNLTVGITTDGSFEEGEGHSVSAGTNIAVVKLDTAVSGNIMGFDALAESTSMGNIDSELSTTSVNPVQNRVITNKINEIEEVLQDTVKYVTVNVLPSTGEEGTIYFVATNEVDSDSRAIYRGYIYKDNSWVSVSNAKIDSFTAEDVEELFN